MPIRRPKAPSFDSTPPQSGLPLPPDRRDPGPILERHAVADYILDLSGQLARIASDARLDFLAYLLDMVQIEAESVRKRAATEPRNGHEAASGR